MAVSDVIESVITAVSDVVEGTVGVAVMFLAVSDIVESGERQRNHCWLSNCRFTQLLKVQSVGDWPALERVRLGSN